MEHLHNFWVLSSPRFWSLTLLRFASPTSMRQIHWEVSPVLMGPFSRPMVGEGQRTPFGKSASMTVALVTQLCPSLCDPMDCSPPGSSVHGILQARALEWVAIPFSRGSSPPRDWTLVSLTAGRLSITATQEAPRCPPSNALCRNDWTGDISIWSPKEDWGLRASPKGHEGISDTLSFIPGRKATVWTQKIASNYENFSGNLAVPQPGTGFTSYQWWGINIFYCQLLADQYGYQLPPTPPCLYSGQRGQTLGEEFNEVQCPTVIHVPQHSPLNSSKSNSPLFSNGHWNLKPHFKWPRSKAFACPWEKLTGAIGLAEKFIWFSHSILW